MQPFRPETKLLEEDIGASIKALPTRAQGKDCRLPSEPRPVSAVHSSLRTAQ